MEILEVMRQRHSVRQYEARPIEAEKRETLNALAAQANETAGLHIQIIYDEPKCFDSFMAHYGKFTGVANYIALVGPKGPKLEENLGYYGEELVLKAQALGLNTCWVALTHGKSSAKVEKGEKMVCLISLGYGETQGAERKSKAVEELFTATEPAPDWFRTGMEAAQLAPTAMNQQKFHIRLEDDGTVSATAGSGFYTKLDLGIVKYHFEAVTGKQVRT